MPYNYESLIQKLLSNTLTYQERIELIAIIQKMIANNEQIINLLQKTKQK